MKICTFLFLEILAEYNNFASVEDCANPEENNDKIKCETAAEDDFIFCTHDCNSEQICINECVRDYFRKLDGCPCAQRCLGMILFIFL